MNWYLDKQTMTRALLLSLILVALTLLGGCSDEVEETAEADTPAQTQSCAENEMETGLPVTVASAGDAAEAMPPHTTARWYLDGRLTAEDLTLFYQHINYELGAVSSGGAPVPRLLLARMPSDLRRVNDVEDRKTLFFAAVLPMALQVNETLLRQRRALIAAADCLRKEGDLPPAVRHWMNALHERYGTQGDLDRLIRHVDAVPPSLILAQAAIESHWGMSQFARQGNALFGERTYRNEAGMVPAGIGEAAPFRVRRFETLLESIETYVYNLNVSYAYADFREMRAESRQKGEALDGHTLAGGLKAYSERGTAYIDDLRTIIGSNGLQAFDGAALERVEHAEAREAFGSWARAADI